MKRRNKSLFDDYKFKKPTEEQLFFIRDKLNSYLNTTWFKVNFFENKLVNKNKESSIIPIPKKEWNYWIIEHSQEQMSKIFPLVLGLSKLDLTVVFEGVNIGIYGSLMKSPLVTINFFYDSRHRLEEKNISEDEIKQIRQLNALITAFKSLNGYDFIDKALDDFLRLKEISEASPFKILGYFSIFEHLLTTNEAKNVRENSLKHQLAKKLNLLNNLIAEKIDINQYFKGSDTNTFETIIEKLYQYRNDIAHGNRSDFEKDLKIFKNQKKEILVFLHHLLRLILIKALKEPQLIEDLKKC